MSKRVLEDTDRRGPPPNDVGRHAVVVELWWDQRVPDHVGVIYSLLFLLSHLISSASEVKVLWSHGCVTEPPSRHSL
jgi:hypothetical protein